MRQEMRRRLVITLTSAAMLFGFAAVSSATSITFQLGTVFSGPTPAGTAPFVTVNFVSDVDCPICGVFDPEGGFFNGTTLVTITNNLAGNEFVRTVLLNVGP